MLRLRDFLARRSDPLQLEALTGERGARPAAPRRRGRRAGAGAGRVHRALRAEPAARLRRDRDHLSAVAVRRAAPEAVAGAVLRVRPALHLRDQGAGGAAGDARAGPGRAAFRCCAASSRRPSSIAGSSRSSRRRSRRAPPSTAPWPTSTASACSSSGAPGIGKSECVLDLVERGHRLVADDVVQVDPARQRHPDRTGPRAGRASHGDPRASA